MPKTIQDHVLGDLRGLWASNPRLTGTEIHTELTRKFGEGAISLRKVQLMLSKARTKSGPKLASGPEPWKPWECSEERPNETGRLLELQSHFLERRSRGLYQYEAIWAKRLLPITDYSFTPTFYFLLSEATRREAMALTWNESVELDDFAELLAFRPWESLEAFVRYIDAYVKGAIHRLEVTQLMIWTAEGRDGKIRHQTYSALAILVQIAGNSDHEMNMPKEMFDEIKSTFDRRGDDLNEYLLVTPIVDLEPVLTEMLLHKAFGKDLDVSLGVDVMKKASEKAAEDISRI